jgi:hypothetical protein
MSPKRKGPVKGPFRETVKRSREGGLDQAPLKTGRLEKKQSTSPTTHTTVIAYMAFVNAPVVVLM